LSRSRAGARHGRARALLALLLAAASFLPAGGAAARTAPPPAGEPAPTPAQSLPIPAALPRVRAASFLLADAATGQTLLARAPSTARPMASTTKVMTALLAIEQLDLDRQVRIGPGPAAVGEESLKLRAGERLTVRELLEGLLIKSANDAAVALAEAVDGSQAAFVRRMNARARTLGLRATHYVTPHGLDRPGHATSARDLGRLWSGAMRLPAFRALVATPAAQLPGPPATRRFRTTDQLLGSYPWTLGGKTGFTNLAGRCLVASAERGGRRLVAVALGSTDAFSDVRALFEYGFTAFVRARLAQAGQTVAAPGGAALTVTTTVDALVRPEQLGQLGVEPGAAAPDGTARRLRLLAGGRPVATLAVGPAAPGATAQPLRARPLPPRSVPPVIDPFMAPAAGR